MDRRRIEGGTWRVVGPNGEELGTGKVLRADNTFRHIVLQIGNAIKDIRVPPGYDWGIVEGEDILEAYNVDKLHAFKRDLDRELRQRLKALRKGEVVDEWDIAWRNGKRAMREREMVLDAKWNSLAWEE